MYITPNPMKSMTAISGAMVCAAACTSPKNCSIAVDRSKSVSSSIASYSSDERFVGKETRS
jgi:hypothetical protein